MDAGTLHCPTCGAPSRDQATACAHCGSRLATISCPSCFGLVFTGSKHCPHCGAKAERLEKETAAPSSCPRCREPLHRASLGAVSLRECAKCNGLWLDTQTFNRICADREQQAAVIGGEAVPPVNPGDFNLSNVRYVGCPVCGKLMNRVNFASQSGVILDICKTDGIWFDQEELRRIVEFIRDGGLEKARARDRERWEAEKRRLEAARRFAPQDRSVSVDTNAGSSSVFDAVDVGEIVFSIVRAGWKFLS